MASLRRVPAVAMLLCACVALASCATALKRAEADLAQIEVWLPGRYDNVEQVQREAQNGAPSHAALALNIVPIHMPTFGDHVFYLQESAANDARRIVTQRLLSFEAMDDGHVLERLYAFTQPSRWRDGHLNPDLFKGMMYNDATALTGCELMWKKEGTHFVAANPGGSCRMTVPALGGGVRMEMRAELSADAFSVAEVAFDAAGRVVQGDSAEPFYRYRKRAGF